MKNTLIIMLLLSTFSVKVNANETVSFKKNQWEVLQYSKIKPNSVNFTNQSMTIAVNQSASPVIYRIKSPKIVKEIVLDADIMGALKLKNTQQGTKGNDDFSLRIGLVYQGDKRLGFLQKKIAPPWVKKLYSMAPKNVGVSNVEFFGVYQDKRLANQRKADSELFIDNFIIEQPKNGKIQTTIKVNSNKPVLALWVNSDGDDTNSAFKVKINKLVLK